MKLVNVNVELMQVLCNDKQHWNNDDCRCERKELTVKNVDIIKCLLAILVYVYVNVTNHVMLENI